MFLSSANLGRQRIAEGKKSEHIMEGGGNNDVYFWSICCNLSHLFHDALHPSESALTGGVQLHALKKKEEEEEPWKRHLFRR